MISHFFSLTLVALASALVLLPVLNRLAHGCGWVDAPSERKNHVGTIPLTGGLTVALGAMAALVVSSVLWPELGRPIFALTGWPRLPWPAEAAGLLVGLILCFIIGFWDDRFPLRARYRFMAQLSAAGCVVLAGTVLTSMGTTFSPVPIGLSLLAAPVTMVAITGVVNAYNMSDGLDGLCGGYAAIALAAFAVCAGLIVADHASSDALAQLGPVILPFLGAVVGFLYYNMRHPWREKAGSFLGDAGSMSLGFLIGWLAVRLASGYGADSIPPVTAVWIVALPLIDMFACMIRRPLEGRTPMSADRRHIHHLLMARGLSVRQAVATLHLISIGLATVAIIAWQRELAAWWSFWLLIAAFVAYTAYSIGFWRRRDAPKADSLGSVEDLILPASGAGAAASSAVGQSRSFST